MSGHVGRIGGRQVVAVLALGGGLLLGPVLPAPAAEGNAAAPGDPGPVPTAPDAARNLAPALRSAAGAHALTRVLPPLTGRAPAGRTVRGAG
ncbi:MULTISPECIES: hypothetical protein [unclassified Streptomyces]|uniref:hypothetical protein n=1 Tax=unclassified Streptomyces TaxID=2593676 RepID=UPI0033B219AF